MKIGALITLGFCIGLAHCQYYEPAHQRRSQTVRYNFKVNHINDVNDLAQSPQQIQQVAYRTNGNGQPGGNLVSPSRANGNGYARPAISFNRFNQQPDFEGGQRAIDDEPDQETGPREDVPTDQVQDHQQDEEPFTQQTLAPTKNGAGRPRNGARKNGGRKNGQQRPLDVQDIQAPSVQEDQGDLDERVTEPQRIGDDEQVDQQQQQYDAGTGIRRNGKPTNGKRTNGQRTNGQRVNGNGKAKNGRRNGAKGTNGQRVTTGIGHDTGFGDEGADIGAGPDAGPGAGTGAGPGAGTGAGAGAGRPGATAAGDHGEEGDHGEDHGGSTDPIEWLRAAIRGEPGRDYPIYSSVPDTQFRCSDQQWPGYYADPDAQCQVFHICQADGRSDAFLCPNGTIFSQRLFVCVWWHDFDCSTATQYYNLNSQLYLESQEGAGGGAAGGAAGGPAGGPGAKDSGLAAGVRGPAAGGLAGGPTGGAAPADSFGETDDTQAGFEGTQPGAGGLAAGGPGAGGPGAGGPGAGLGPRRPSKTSGRPLTDDTGVTDVRPFGGFTSQPVDQETTDELGEAGVGPTPQQPTQLGDEEPVSPVGQAIDQQQGDEEQTRLTTPSRSQVSFDSDFSRNGVKSVTGTKGGRKTTQQQTTPLIRPSTNGKTNGKTNGRSGKTNGARTNGARTNGARTNGATTQQQEGVKRTNGITRPPPSGVKTGRAKTNGMQLAIRNGGTSSPVANGRRKQNGNGNGLAPVVTTSIPVSPATILRQRNGKNGRTNGNGIRLPTTTPEAFGGPQDRQRAELDYDSSNYFVFRGRQFGRR